MSAEPEQMNQLLELIGKMLDRLDRMSQAPAPVRQADQTEGIAQLAEALAAAQGEFTNPDRTKTAKVKGKTKEGVPYEYDYKYSDLADIFNVIRGAMSKYCIAIVQTARLDSSASEAVVRTTLLHKSGEWVRSELRFPWTGGKIQDLGSVFTYLRRYSLSAMIGIAPEEDDDGKAADTSNAADGRSGKGNQKGQKPDKNAGDMPTEEQLAQFWVEWKEVWPTKFAAKEEAWAWLKEIDLNPSKANLGQLRSILQRLKVKRGKDDQAETKADAGDKGKKPPAKGQPKQVETPEQKLRKAIQQRWNLLVGDKFVGVEKDHALQVACWWAGVHYGWVRNPETETDSEGRIWPTRPRATLTAVENIRKAVDALAPLQQADLEEMANDYGHWLNEQLLELNPPAGGDGAS